ncbi:hypothetical protein AB0L04_26930 [Streptomyces glaucescens]|uniref:hypothetical protein n=1 Tax=Streptomyces glaucescens TaxID=1907 RepID=UPI00344B224B
MTKPRPPEGVTAGEAIETTFALVTAFIATDDIDDPQLRGLLAEAARIPHDTMPLLLGLLAGLLETQAEEEGVTALEAWQLRAAHLLAHFDTGGA